MTRLTYLCPFCTSPTEITAASVGDPVACTSCARPFRTHVPRGVLVEQVDGDWRPVSQRTPRATEATLTCVHPAPFRRAPLQLTLLSLLVAGGIAAALLFGDTDPGVRAGVTALWGGLAVAFAAGLPLAFGFLTTRFETLTVTDRRSVWRRGILVRRVSEVEHEDIRNIQVRQGPTDQLLGVGSLSISSAAQSDMEITVRGLRRPDDVVALIRKHQGRAAVEYGARRSA